MARQIVLVAGGTGGHINAALSVGKCCQNKGYHVSYLTGMRDLDFKLFQGQSVTHLKSRTIRSKKLWSLFANLFSNLKVFLQCFFMFIRKRPQFILGAGGYVCGPSLMAGFFLGIPLFILEQNATMGLTNKFLSHFSRLVFLHFEPSKKKNSKFITVGNPVRQEIYKVLDEGPRNKEKFQVLVFGGSLGSEDINQFIYQFIQKEPPFPLVIKHQLGKNDQPNLLEIHQMIEYEVFSYIDNMAEAYKNCDMILCRAGASTISELRIVQKPVLLLPYPYATDDHQTKNAESLKAEVNFPVLICRKSELTLEKFTDFLQRAAKTPWAPQPYKTQHEILIIKKIEKYLEERK